MKAVLFDVDGTLLNTHEFIVSAYEHALQSIGKPITRTEAETYLSVGKNLRGTYMHMVPNEDTELLAARHHEFQLDKFHLIKPYDGARDVLSTLKQAGYKLAAVTNRSRSSAVPSLEQARLNEFFDVRICPEDTVRTKPDPEHIYTALRALERDAEHSWMVGDTYVDIEAARAAGVRSIGISHTRNEAIRENNPHHVVFSLPEILPIVLK
jgi:pyrophosphatase PpaX